MNSQQIGPETWNVLHWMTECAWSVLLDFASLPSSDKGNDLIPCKPTFLFYRLNISVCINLMNCIYNSFELNATYKSIESY